MNRNRTLELELEPDLEAWRQARKILGNNPEEGLPILRGLAEQGSMLAALELGRAFALGIGAPVNVIEAERWFRTVAETRSVRGHYFLGRLFLRMKRYHEAQEAYKFSAARGYAPALHDLGKIYLLGLGVDKSTDQAVRYLVAAADSDSVFAKRLLARTLMRTGADLKTKTTGFLYLLDAWGSFIRALIAEGPYSERLLR